MINFIAKGNTSPFCDKCGKPFVYVGDVPTGGFSKGSEPYCTCCYSSVEEKSNLFYSLENSALDRLDRLYREISDLKIANAKLKDQLREWQFELAYYTSEEMATPEGVKKFIDDLLNNMPDKEKDNG